MSDEFQTTVLAALRQLQSGQDGLRTEFAGLRSEFSGLRDEFSGLRDEFGGLRGEFGGLRGEFAELRAAQASTEAGLSRLQVDLEVLRSVVVSASSETTNLRIQLMARMDRIQDVAKDINQALVLIREDIGVNYARADRIDVKSDAAAEITRTLTVEMVVLQRQVKRLEEDVRTILGRP